MWLQFVLYYSIYDIFLHRFLYSIYASTLMVIHNIQCCSLIRLWVQSTIHIRSLQVLTELREWLYAWLARSTTDCLANNTSDLCSMGELPSLSLSMWVPVGLCFWGQCWLPRVMDQVTENHARLESPWVWRWVWHWKRGKCKGKQTDNAEKCQGKNAAFHSERCAWESFLLAFTIPCLSESLSIGITKLKPNLQQEIVTLYSR